MQVSGAGNYFDSPLYSEKKKLKIFWIEKNAKITRRFYGYKGSANTYNVEILNSIILNMQLEVS